MFFILEHGCADRADIRINSTFLILHTRHALPTNAAGNLLQSRILSCLETVILVHSKVSISGHTCVMINEIFQH